MAESVSADSAVFLTPRPLDGLFFIASNQAQRRAVYSVARADRKGGKAFYRAHPRRRKYLSFSPSGVLRSVAGCAVVMLYAHRRTHERIGAFAVKLCYPVVVMSEVHSTPRWARLRERIRRRDCICVMCAARGITTPGDDVDHIRPIKDGGAVWDEDNLQFLCKQCHKDKTAAEDSMRKRNWISVDVNGNLIGERR